MQKDTFSIDDSVGYAIYRTGKALKFELRRSFRQAGIDVTSEQWALLCRLWEQEGRSQKELAECSFKDTANITRMIDVLEGKGIVFRERDQHDRRTYRIFLTEEGHRLRDRLMPIFQADSDMAFDCLTPEEQQSLLSMLNRLYNHVCTIRDKR